MKFGLRARAGAAFLAACTLGACASTVQSVRLGQATTFDQLSASTAGERHALVYALPMRLVRMTVTGTPTPPATITAAVTALADAQKARGDASDALGAAERELAIINARRAADAASVTDEALADARKKVTDARTALQQRTAAVVAAEAAMVAAQARAAGDTPSGGLNIAIKFELVAPMADPREAYQSTFDHYWHRDDTVSISTTDGLLTSSDVTTTDRTADILIDVAGIAGAARERSNLETLWAAEAPTDQCRLGRQFAREFTFDPSTPENVTTAGGIVPGYAEAASWMQRCLNLTLDIPSIRPFANGPTSEAQNTAPGLVYRRPIPYLISVRRGSGASLDTIASTVAMLPQGGPYGVAPFEPRAFVRSVTQVSFDAGQPTKWHTDNPSELAAAFRIPVAMARALIEVPAQLVQLRVNYNNNQSSLVQSQRAYICALEALAEAEGVETPGNCAAH